MKKIILNKLITSCIIIALIAACSSSKAQWQCLTPSQANYNFENTTPSICDDLVNYIPDTSFNYKNTPILTYKINIHLFRKTDGSGVYQYSDTTNINQQVEWVNYIYANINQPVLVTNPVAPYINDSRIRFKLMGIYFHDNDNFYTNNWSNSISYNTFGINKASEINVFYFQDPNKPNGGGCATLNYININACPYICLNCLSLQQNISN
ncbi:MAG: hypothetical protein GY756_18935, partial [bacterium]|nr:hypothetical protein [bacterium]